jgi:hypothetical protein
MIRPFEKLFQRQAINKIATRKWVTTMLRRVFGLFNLSGQGIEFQETGEGGLMLKVSSTLTTTPFQVIRKGDGVIVMPGMVFSNDFSLPNNPFVSSFPRINNVSINNQPPPVLAVSSTAWIVLRMIFAKESGSAKFPWSIVRTGTLKDVPLVRSVGDALGNDSEVDLPIARIENGQITQIVSSTIYVTTSWNTIVIGGSL